MKKVLFIVLFCMIVLIGCNTNSNHSKYNQEIIEIANQFRFNDVIDTINLYSLDAKVFQTVFDKEGLCSELSDRDYKWYHGQTLYYISKEQLYDDKIINNNVIFLGTYRYEGKDSDYHTVPLYCDVEVYRKGIVDKIKKIQNSNKE